MTRLSLLTWNVHGLPIGAAQPHLRLPRIADWTRQRAPDLVLFQEVWSGAYAGQLSSALPEYESFSVAHRFTRRPRGGLLTLVRGGEWRAADALFERFDAAAPWQRLSEGDGLAGKGILAVFLRGSRDLIAVNTHLQAQYEGRDYADVRRSQIEQLTAFLERNCAGTPVVLAGDLNTEASEELYRSHLACLGVDLTLDERRLRGGATCFDRRGGRTEWIDYVFVRGLTASASIVRIESEAPDVPYSDHDGVLATIELDEKT